MQYKLSVKKQTECLPEEAVRKLHHPTERMGYMSHREVPWVPSSKWGERGKADEARSTPVRPEGGRCLARGRRWREKAAHSKKGMELPSPRGNKQPPCFGNVCVCLCVCAHVPVHTCDYRLSVCQSEEGGLYREGNKKSLMNFEGTCYISEDRHKESRGLPSEFRE